MVSKKIIDFLSKNADLPTPFLVVDTSLVEKKYKEFVKAYGKNIKVYYAVKCNPAKEVLQLLDKLGSCFDVASYEEIELCLSLGINPNKLSWGSTIKKASLIKKAYEQGIKLYAFDSEEELLKIAENAPKSQVYCRIMVSNDDAQWALSKKFGCSLDMAEYLTIKAKELNLDPLGISFHVGSQQLNANAWREALMSTATVFNNLENKHNIKLKMVNIGGGYPAYGYLNTDVPCVSQYSHAVSDTLKEYFNSIPEIYAEPGRFIVGDTGIIKTEVILVSKKSYYEDIRWVYLDVGVFGGLAETLDECIKYNITTELLNKKNSTIEDVGEVAIAGPTCDGMDIMYKDYKYKLPMSLKSGDYLYIHSTGAYTTTYCSVAFNGFKPIKDYYI